MDKTIHIIIIDYFKSKQVIKSVDSILKQNYSLDKVLISIIDNSCDEENFNTLKQHLPPSVNLTKSPENLGYTKAANKAAFSSDKEFDILCLLNPDVILTDQNTFKNITANFFDPNCLIAGPAQVNEDGSIPEIVRNYPSPIALVLKRSPLKNLPLARSIVHKYLMSDFDYTKRQAVPWLQSSCVFIDFAFWCRIGGLNSKYFLFMADIEICEKAYSEKGVVIYDPTSKVLADGKRCSEGGLFSLFSSQAMRHHVKDACKYYLGKI